MKLFTIILILLYVVSYTYERSRMHYQKNTELQAVLYPGDMIDCAVAGNGTYCWVHSTVKYPERTNTRANNTEKMEQHTEFIYILTYMQIVDIFMTGVMGEHYEGGRPGALVVVLYQLADYVFTLVMGDTFTTLGTKLQATEEAELGNPQEERELLVRMIQEV